MVQEKEKWWLGFKVVVVVEVTSGLVKEVKV